MRIRLSAEYECHPLWIVHDDGLENVVAQNLELSDALCSAIEAWDRLYQATYVPDDPMASDFASPDEERSFEQEGVLLRARLKSELEGKAIVE